MASTSQATGKSTLTLSSEEGTEMECIRIFCNGVEVTPQHEGHEAVAIDCWYDPHYRHWVLYPVDADGNQLDEASYGFGKHEAMRMKKGMEQELIGKIYE